MSGPAPQSKMETEFDFVVIGGGSAGYAAARTAAAAGLLTAVADGSETLGGLCILRGCMPSKTILESANRFFAIRHAAAFGIHAPDPRFSTREIRARKEALIADFAAHRQSQLTSGKFALFRGNASFTSPHTIKISGEDSASEISAKSFLIATGSRPNFPPIPGIELAITSDDLLETAEVPDSAIVLGGGPVALEAAHYYGSFGCRTTVIQRGDRLLRSCDPDISDALRAAIERRGTEVFTGTTLEKIEKTGERFSVSFRANDGARLRMEAQTVLNALGRAPASENLGLANAGVETEKSFVRTLPSQQTSAPHIFAAGDVCGPHEIVHIAIQQGEIAARNAARLLAGAPASETADYRLKVFAVFTEPQVAQAGATEAELASAGIPFHSASYPFSDHGKSLVHGETEGFVKLLAHAETGEILGASAVGPQASELIHETVVAMRYHATALDFSLIPHYHPTLSEIWTYPAEELAETCGKRSNP